MWIVAITLVVMGAGVGVWLWLKRRRRDAWFATRVTEEALYRHVTGGAFAMTVSEGEIASWIEDWLARKPEPKGGMFQATTSVKLRQVGRRALPHLLRALDDPRCSPEAKPDPRPFLEVTDMLTAYSLPELVERAKAWSRSGRPEARARGVEILAASGAVFAVEAVAEAVADDEAARHACTGIMTAVKSGLAEAAYLESVRQALRKRFDAGDAKRFGGLYGAMVAVDSRDGSVIAAELRVGMSDLHLAIDVLNKANFPIDSKSLQAIMRAPVSDFGSASTREMCIDRAVEAIRRVGGAGANEDLLAVINDRSLDAETTRQWALHELFQANGFPKLVEITHLDREDAPRCVRLMHNAAWIAGKLDQDVLIDRIGDHRSWSSALSVARALNTPKTAESLLAVGQILGFEEGKPPAEDAMEFDDDVRDAVSEAASVYVGAEDLWVVLARYGLEHAEELRAWKRAIAK